MNPTLKDRAEKIAHYARRWSNGLDSYKDFAFKVVELFKEKKKKG